MPKNAFQPTIRQSKTANPNDPSTSLPEKLLRNQKCLNLRSIVSTLPKFAKKFLHQPIFARRSINLWRENVVLSQTPRPNRAVLTLIFSFGSTWFSDSRRLRCRLDQPLVRIVCGKKRPPVLAEDHHTTYSPFQNAQFMLFESWKFPRKIAWILSLIFFA